MKKQLIIIVILLVVSLSGCNEEKGETSDSIIINKFEVSPAYIQYGETTNLTWDVTGAETVIIDNNIGTVSLSGNRTIQPTQNTTYTLTALTSAEIKTATAQIIVEEVPPVPAPSLAWSADDADNTLTITSGSAFHNYASATSANLVFKKAGVEYFVDTNYDITISGTMNTNPISAGDVFDFNLAGTGIYQIIWKPTNKLLGEATFT